MRLTFPRAILALVAFAFLLAPMPARAAPRPALPTPADLERALSAAVAAWGATSADPVSIKLAALNACDVTADAHPVIASTVTTWTAFDGGARSYSHVIEINSGCDWRMQPLGNAVLHEYGHILMGADHSSDPHSVMFWIVKGTRQRITTLDRARLAEVIP